nr:hypothetical protein [Tanacetum cinerariifolium]
MGISRIHVPNKEHVSILFRRRLIASINILTLNVMATVNIPKLISNFFKLFVKSVLFEADHRIKKRESSMKKVEKDRTLTRLEELKFLATSTKDLDDVDAYWIKKQKRLIRNKLKNDLGAEDDEDEDE